MWLPVGLVQPGPGNALALPASPAAEIAGPPHSHRAAGPPHVLAGLPHGPVHRLAGPRRSASPAHSSAGPPRQACQYVPVHGGAR